MKLQKRSIADATKRIPIKTNVELIHRLLVETIDFMAMIFVLSSRTLYKGDKTHFPPPTLLDKTRLFAQLITGCYFSVVEFHIFSALKKITYMEKVDSRKNIPSLRL